MCACNCQYVFHLSPCLLALAAVCTMEMHISNLQLHLLLIDMQVWGCSSQLLVTVLLCLPAGLFWPNSCLETYCVSSLKFFLLKAAIDAKVNGNYT